MGTWSFLDEPDGDAPKRGILARMFGFMGKRKRSVEEELDEVPAVQRVGRRPVDDLENGRELRPGGVAAGRSSIWERREVAEVRAPKPAPRRAKPVPEDDQEIVPISGAGG